MAKKSQKKNSQEYRPILAFDLGGTKVLAAVVSYRGKILNLEKAKVNLKSGPTGLIRQMVTMGQRVSEGYQVRACGVSSAGPLDPSQGVLLNPTNLKTKGRPWGVVSLAAGLQRGLKLPVRLENDAACAVLAEKWIGHGRPFENVVAITLGTGLGVGILVNGHLLRSGRNLHTEVGHIIMDTSATAPLCGCGNRGCAEAILSGVNFTKSLARDWKMPDLKGEDLVAMAAAGDRRAKKAFRAYGILLAKFIVSVVVQFSPEKVILSGGFSSAYRFFQRSLHTELKRLLRTRRSGVDLLPDVEISEIAESAGILGAARLIKLK